MSERSAAEGGAGAPGGPGSRVTPADIRRWGPVWSRRVGWALAHLVWHTTVIGAENVPRTGRVLVAPNHTGIVDGPLVHSVIPRSSYFLVKEEFFTSRFGFLMRWSGQIPIERSNGRPALDTALALLEEERCVGVFPEGTRGRGDVAAARAGIAWLAVNAGAPVVPCAVLGTRPPGRPRNYFPRPRDHFYVAFGEPIEVEQGGGRREVARTMKTVQRAMVDLLEQAQARSGMSLPEQ